jgi:hypothetical protein
MSYCRKPSATCGHVFHCPGCGDGWDSGEARLELGGDGDVLDYACECGTRYRVTVAICYGVEVTARGRRRMP